MAEQKTPEAKPLSEDGGAVEKAIEKAKEAYPSPRQIKAVLPKGVDGNPATIDNPEKA